MIAYSNIHGKFCSTNLTYNHKNSRFKQKINISHFVPFFSSPPPPSPSNWGWSLRWWSLPYMEKLPNLILSWGLPHTILLCLLMLPNIALVRCWLRLESIVTDITEFLFPLSLVLELETHPSSLSLAHGQKPCTACYIQQAGGLLLPSLHHWFIFILSKCFPTISVDPYDLVIFEEKCYICKVIAAMLISTKPPLIPGINHDCLWSLAPASTMVRLRLEMVARESSYPTELDTYNDGWLVSMFNHVPSGQGSLAPAKPLLNRSIC